MYNNNKDLDDNGKLNRKYNNKRSNAKKEGIPFELSFDEYCQLVRDAGLKSSDLGLTGNNYELARYNDTGPYAVGNCRFITHKENIAEQKRSEKQSAASRNNIIKYRNSSTHEERVANLKKSEKLKNYQAKRAADAKINSELKDLNKHPSYKGKLNSQFGSYWITNGIINKKWRDESGPIPDGFGKGRKC